MNQSVKISLYSAAALLMIGGVSWGAGRKMPPAPPPLFEGIRFCEHLRRECQLTVEDAVARAVAGRHRPWRYYAESVKIPLPKGKLGPEALVRYLRAQMPTRWQIWRDRHQKNVVHVALKRLLAWKKNPLNARLTIKGVYTIRQIETKFIKKICPGISIINLVPSLPGTGGNPMAPDYGIIDTPLRLDVKKMRLRRFLTNGFGYAIKYLRAPSWFGQPIWEAQFRWRDGHIGMPLSLTLCFDYARLVPSAVVHPSGKPHAKISRIGGTSHGTQKWRGPG